MNTLLKVVLIFLISGSGAVFAEERAPYLYILGVAQDAGFPQAGCYKPHCMPGWNDPERKITATSLGLIDPSSKKKYIFEGKNASVNKIVSYNQGRISCCIGSY